MRFDDYLEEQLKNPEFKKEYDALEREFADIRARIDEMRSQDTQMLDKKVRSYII